MMAFGKAGAAMVPILNLGKKGIQDFLDQAKAMGVVITKEQFEQAERFEQNIKRMEQALHGLWVEITNATLPVLNDLTEQVSKTEKTKGFWSVMGEVAAILTQGQTAINGYVAEGQKLIENQAKTRKKVTEGNRAIT